MTWEGWISGRNEVFLGRIKNRKIMDSAKEIRSDILEILFKIEDVSTLESIRHQLKVVHNAGKESVPSFMEAVKPIRENVSLEELIAEQHYKPITYEHFRKKVADIQWEESLETLLGALTK